jgi:hypothetical protein
MQIPEMPTMEVYESADNIGKIEKSRCNPLNFGDIFLEDLRKYREDKLATMDLKAFFHFEYQRIT